MADTTGCPPSSSLAPSTWLTEPGLHRHWKHLCSMTPSLIPGMRVLINLSGTPGPALASSINVSPGNRLERTSLGPIPGLSNQKPWGGAQQSVFYQTLQMALMWAYIENLWCKPVMAILFPLPTAASGWATVCVTSKS